MDLLGVEELILGMAILVVVLTVVVALMMVAGTIKQRIIILILNQLEAEYY